jgi:mRNA interferase RelE/StbE
MYKIEWKTKALKQTLKIPKRERICIFNAIETLQHWPKCKHVKPIIGQTAYRLRIGRYRAIFAIKESIEIIEVKKRDERTY